MGLLDLVILVAISKALTFKGLTLPVLWAWFCVHPFVFFFFLLAALWRLAYDIRKKD